MARAKSAPSMLLGPGRVNWRCRATIGVAAASRRDYLSPPSAQPPRRSHDPVRVGFPSPPSPPPRPTRVRLPLRAPSPIGPAHAAADDGRAEHRLVQEVLGALQRPRPGTAFQNCYAPDATSESVDSGQPPAQGRAAIIETAKATVAPNPDVHGELQLMLANGQHLMSIALWKGTHTAPMPGPGGQSIPATGKSFGILMAHTVELDAGRTAVQADADYVEVGTLLGQLGLSKAPVRKAMESGAAAPTVVIAKNDDAEAKNVAAIQAQLEAFNKHDVAASASSLADNYVLHEVALPADSNKKQALASLKDLFKGFGDVKLTASQVYGAGDYVVVIGTFEGTNTGPMPDLGIKKGPTSTSSPVTSRSSASRTARSPRTGSSTTAWRSRRSSACRSRRVGLAIVGQRVARAHARARGVPAARPGELLRGDGLAALRAPARARGRRRRGGRAGLRARRAVRRAQPARRRPRAAADGRRPPAGAERRAPRLAAHYPTAGGRAGLDGAWDAFRELVVEQRARLQPLVALPCQTNEVGRCARARVRLPRARASATGCRCGCSRSARAPASTCASTTSATAAAARASGRRRARSTCRACGSRRPRTCRTRSRSSSGGAATCGPIDIATAEGRLQLESSLWADQVDAARTPARRLRAGRARSRRASSAPRSTSGCRACWPSRGAARRRWSSTRSSTSTSRDARAAGVPPRRSTRAGAARHARRAARLAALRSDARDARLRTTLTTWPGGEERVVATAGAHGADVRRPA